MGGTQLAIGLSIRACQAGHRVAFATAAEWVARPSDAHAQGRLQAELTRFGRIPLLAPGGLHHPVAVRIRDEHSVNKAGMDVSSVRREHPDEIKPILGAVHHQHMAVGASAEPGVVSASRVLPLTGLVRFRRSRRRKPKG
ncbi:MAG TPA: ATP-binding protein, partial [Acidimicrobiales bacterium]|nr:ATP-binding protein [Acidimicrobiales bacterium]